jgi:hypothetical protein
MRRYLFVALGVLAGCVADPERARGPDVGDAGGSESGMSECRARAQRVNGERNVLVAQYLCWIEENSGYRSLQPPAYWVDLSKDDVTALGARFAGRAASAMYTCGASTMYMNKDWNIRDVVPSSVLLHELVHHAQCTRGSMMAAGAILPGDTCAIEREAYALQAKYVHQLSDRAATEQDRIFLRANADQFLKTADRVCQGLGIR